MIVEIDKQIIESAYQLYKYTYLLRSTDLGRGKMRPHVDGIFDAIRVILAECSVYSLSIADIDSGDDAFFHYQHFVRQFVNQINVLIYLLSHNQEQYPFDEIQLQYVTMLEKYFHEFTEHLDKWAGSNFDRTIFSSHSS